MTDELKDVESKPQVVETSSSMDELMERMLAVVNDADPQAAKKRVEALRERFPQDEDSRLVERLVKQKCMSAGAVGAVTSGTAVIPGLGTFFSMTFGLAADVAVTFRMQAELILEIAAVYGKDLDAGERRRAILLVTGLGAGAQKLVEKAGEQVSRRATEHLAERSLVKAVPLIGVGLSAGMNTVTTYLIGRRAQAYFGLGEERLEGWAETARALSGLDERKLAEWLAETTKSSWTSLSGVAKNASGVVVGAGKTAVGAAGEAASAVAGFGVNAADTVLDAGLAAGGAVVDASKCAAGAVGEAASAMAGFGVNAADTVLEAGLSAAGSVTEAGRTGIDKVLGAGKRVLGMACSAGSTVGGAVGALLGGFAGGVGAATRALKGLFAKTPIEEMERESTTQELVIGVIGPETGQLTPDQVTVQHATAELSEVEGAKVTALLEAMSHLDEIGPTLEPSQELPVQDENEDKVGLMRRTLSFIWRTD